MSIKGLALEQKISQGFHANRIPVLVSARLLRERNLGQLDLVALEKKNNNWILEVAEVKSSVMGVENLARSQYKRIREAQNFLAGIFGVATRLRHLPLEEE